VSLASALLRGAGAGTLAALALALFLLVLAPKERVVSSTTIYEVTNQLARGGVTVVRPATVNESVFDHPFRSLGTAGLAVSAGLAAGVTMAALDRRFGWWWAWLLIGAAASAAVVAGTVSSSMRVAVAWLGFWLVLALSWVWSGRSAALSAARP